VLHVPKEGAMEMEDGLPFISISLTYILIEKEKNQELVKCKFLWDFLFNVVVYWSCHSVDKRKHTI
jgi:hypothetical protein